MDKYKRINSVYERMAKDSPVIVNMEGKNIISDNGVHTFYEDGDEDVNFDKELGIEYDRPYTHKEVCNIYAREVLKYLVTKSVDYVAIGSAAVSAVSLICSFVIGGWFWTLLIITCATFAGGYYLLSKQVKVDDVKMIENMPIELYIGNSEEKLPTTDTFIFVSDPKHIKMKERIEAEKVQLITE